MITARMQHVAVSIAAGAVVIAFLLSWHIGNWF
ncbi:protein of unknown function [Pararobbsia alpina]